MNSQIQYDASVALYALCFLATAGLACLAQIFAKKSRPVNLALSITGCNRPNRIFWVLSLLIPFLLSSFRWQVGTDYSTYISLYNSFAHMDTFSQFVNQLPVTEPSFIILNLIVKVIFNHYLFVFALSALLILAFFYRATEDYHDQLSVALAIFVFLTLLFATTLNILRQMIAVAIVFYATRYIFQHKYGKAAALLILAVSFHYTALIILPFWILREKKRWHKNVRIILFSILTIVVVGSFLFRQTFEQLPLIGLLAQNTAPGASLGLGLLLLRAPIIIPVLFFRKKLMEHDERNYYWIILMIFELAFSGLGYIFDVFSRLALYFAVSWIVLLPALVRCMPTRAAQYGMGAYVLLMVSALWVFNTVYNNFGDVLPYKNIFDAYFSGML